MESYAGAGVDDGAGPEGELFKGEEGRELDSSKPYWEQDLLLRRPPILFRA